jgi:hypothetical protein
MESILSVALQNIPRSFASCDDWVAILDLCDHHHIPKARFMAIEHISVDINGVEKVLMGRKYRVKSWLQDGLYDLVQRDASFSDPEADLLGFKTTSKLYRIRDLRFKRGQSNSDKSIIPVINQQFGSELKEMENEDVEPVSFQ